MKIPSALWPRLLPLLDEALALPAAARLAWLHAQALPAELDAALRQLLADRDRLEGSDFLARPAVAAIGEAPPPAPAASAHLQDGLFAGDRIGPYRLIRLLGQGGMSVVWLAERDDGQARRQVALKMPHAGPGQALLAERLRRERDILAGLEHRHIARLYDVGVTPQGLPYLVLEHVAGDTLPAYCAQHRLGLRARLKLFLQVLAAVQHAHTQLVLHRDLKPGNILVTPDGEVKLLDFGIAKLIRDADTGSAPSTELTQHSGQVLTPDYAAPEQIAGQPLTTASDVYALGVVLFELLTGQRPYRLPRGTRGALEEAILASQARRPSQAWLDREAALPPPAPGQPSPTLDDLAQGFGGAPRRLSQQLQGDLDLIVATALQKDPARRYPTADAFAQDIAHHLAREPIRARPDSRWYRLRKYVQRNAWPLAAASAVVAALGVGLGVALWQARTARQEAAKATAIQDFLIGLFENGDVEQADAARKRHETVEQLLVSSAHALGTQLQQQPAVRAELQGVVGRLLHNLAITDEAIALRRERVAQLAALDAPAAERAQAWRDLADSQDARGDTAAAKASLSQGLALCRAQGLQTQPVCQGLQVAMGFQLAMAGQFEQASALIDPSLALLRRTAPDSIQLADALVVQADLLSNRNRFDASYALYQESIALRARLWGTHSARLAKERYQLAMGLWGQRRLQQADEQLQMAWQAAQAALGASHTNSLVIELQLGRLQVLRSNSAQGRAHVNHAASLLQARSATLDPRTAFDIEQVLGETLLYDGQLEAAGPHLQRAVDLADTLRDRLPDVGAPEANLAWYLQDVGRYDDAIALLARTHARIASAFGADNAFAADLNDRIAGVYLARGQLDQAWQQQVAGLHSKDMLEDTYGSTKHSLTSGQASILMARGRFDEAAPIIESQYAAMRRTPVGEMYRITVFGATEQMARLRAGQHRCAEALPYFEQAIALLQSGDAANPYLAATRARLGLCLLALNRRAPAQAELAAARQVLARHPHIGAHLSEPVMALHQALANAPQM
jgi:serine/threonine-protein kinase